MKSKIRDLPSGVGVTKSVNGHGSTFWRVRLGKRFTGGNVVKRDFTSLSDAREWIFGDAQKGKSKPAPVIELKQTSGASAFSFTPAQLAEAASCLRRLEGKGTLTEAVSYFLKHAKPAGGMRTIKEVAEEFLRARRAMGVRERTLTQYESYLRTIELEFGDRKANEVRQAQIEDWIAESEWSKRTRNNYVSTLSTLFLFAKDRDYCSTNPAEKVPRAILDDCVPGILTVDQARQLLTNAVEEGPDMIAYIAIALFAGLRRSEICSLEWSEVDLKGKTIEVKEAKAKTRQRRIVTVSRALVKWLEMCSDQARPTPSNNEDVCGEKLRALYSERRDKDGKLVRAAVVKEWPHNALRHSFGSYFYAKYQDENKTAAEMGNSPAVVFRHYRAVVRPEAVAAYWEICPASTKC